MTKIEWPYVDIRRAKREKLPCDYCGFDLGADIKRGWVGWWGVYSSTSPAVRPR